jgi:tetratricopeptide (TPR) repeat protein
MIWLVGLALAGTKGDVKAGQQALQEQNVPRAIEAFGAALGPPRLKPRLQQDAWDGLIEASRLQLLGSDVERARAVADAWVGVEAALDTLQPSQRAAAATLVGNALDRLGENGDASDVERVVSLLDVAGRLREDNPDAAIALALVAEGMAVRLWSGDPAADQGEPAAALEVLAAGEARIAAARARADRPALQQVAQHLELVQLDLLADLPGDPRTRPAFDAALATYPENVPLMLRYAGVLERLGERDSAVELYERALVREPDNAVAHFGVAASLMRRAAALSQQMVALDDREAIAAAQAEITALQLQAKPHLEAVLVQRPNDTEALRQLIAIALLEGDAEAVKRYKARLEP